MFFDPLYIVFALPALLLTLIASGLLKYWYGKYSRVFNSGHTNGLQAASLIAEQYGLDVSFIQGQGNLTDNYNPSDETVTLSSRVGKDASVASVAIAAHEMGHVMQYQGRSIIMQFRSFLVPAINIGTNLGYFLIIIGFLIALSGLVWLGIALFSLSTFFTLFTLPIELDASRRGLKAIQRLKLLAKDELPGARKVLFAAALTYVAAATGSIMNLLYFVMRARGMSRD
jgi:Zn-dependent membrane protease YugP